MKWNLEEYDANLEVSNLLKLALTSQLIACRNRVGTLYYKNLVELQDKKKKLLAGGFNQSWGIDFKQIPKIDQKYIVENAELAQHFMLPEVSKEDPNLLANEGNRKLTAGFRLLQRPTRQGDEPLLPPERFPDDEVFDGVLQRQC